MIVDLDCFKLINDTWGPAAGDDALCVLADRLRIFSDRCTTVACTGGEEFAVLITGGPERESQAALATQICCLLSRPLTTLPQPVAACVSIGIARAPEDADSSDGLLRCADAAMYHIKARSAARFISMPLHTGRSCTSGNSYNGKFEVPCFTTSLCHWFQPVISLHTDQISGFELLARAGIIRNAAPCCRP